MESFDIVAFRTRVTRVVTVPENQYDSDAASVPDEEGLEDEIDDRLFFLWATRGMRLTRFMALNPMVDGPIGPLRLDWRDAMALNPVVDEPTERLNFVPVDETGTKTAQEGDDECCVCMHNFPDAMITPCNHAGVCCVCANQIGRTTGVCPLCRTRNITVTRVSGDSSQE